MFLEAPSWSRPARSPSGTAAESLALSAGCSQLAAAPRPPGGSSWRWRHPPPAHGRPRRAGGTAPGPGAGSSRRRGLRGAGPQGACPVPWRRGERRGGRAGRGMTRRAGGARGPAPGTGHRGAAGLAPGGSGRDEAAPPPEPRSGSGARSRAGGGGGH